jgi:hypothetical protein
MENRWAVAAKGKQASQKWRQDEQDGLPDRHSQHPRVKIHFPSKAALPSCKSCSSCLIQVRPNVKPTDYEYSCNDITTTRQKPKTYRSVLGTIFFAGVGKMHVNDHQQLATQIISGRSKKTKIKCLFFARPALFFCQTGPAQAWKLNAKSPSRQDAKRILTGKTW